MKELKSVLGGGSTWKEHSMRYNTCRESMIREFPSADSIGIDFTMAKAADSNSGFERIFYIYFYLKKTENWFDTVKKVSILFHLKNKYFVCAMYQ